MDIKRLAKWPLRFYRVLKYASSLYDVHERRMKEKKEIRFCGEDTRIEQNVTISWPSRLRIGKHCLIMQECILHSMGGIHIGDYVGIGTRCMLVSFSHNYLAPEYLPYDDVITIKPIIIRNFVWIGFGALIMPGVEIGEGAVVGMGATVTKSVPPLAVVAGNPAEIIGYRNKRQFEECIRDKKFAHPLSSAYFGALKEKIPRYFLKKYEKELADLNMFTEFKS